MNNESDVTKRDPLELIEIVPGYRETRSTANIDKALIEFHKLVKVPKKTGEAKVPTRNGKEFSYKYVELPELHKAIDGPLGEVGLVLKQPLLRHENLYGALTILSHPASGEKIIVGPFLLDNEKGGVQGAGSDCTYSRRYSICGLLALAWDDDDDGIGAQTNDTPKHETTRYPSAIAETKKDGEILPYKIPYIKDAPTAAQVNSLEVMCQYVGKNPRDMAAYYKVANLGDLKFYAYRSAYKILASHLIKMGYSQGKDLNWHKADEPAATNPMESFGEPEPDPAQQQIFDEEVPF